MCRARQRIFLLRDTFSSYTITRIIPDEHKDTLKAVLLETTAELKAASGCVIRTDGALPFQSLVHDRSLHVQGIQLEIGRLKNRNKNPVAEKAVQELELELKRAHPEGGPISPVNLAIVTATLNNRIRNRGLTAKEIVFQRDSQSGEQLNLDDGHLAQEQHRLRVANHDSSARSQASVPKPVSKVQVQPGDLIYLKADGDKHTARDIYIVTAVHEEYVYAKKLVGSQFRAKTYVLKHSEIFLVPTQRSQIPNVHRPLDITSDPYATVSSDDEGDNPELVNNHAEDNMFHDAGSETSDEDRPQDDLPVPENVNVADQAPRQQPALPAEGARPQRARRLPEHLKGYDLSCRVSSFYPLC